MCGIAGFAGRGEDRDLAAMRSALSHRGPDAEGEWHDRERAVHLGHTRLSIIDLRGGAQPMWTADGALGVVYNGEVYNHLDLRRELESAGHRFTTDHSDTEALLHGYRQWGEDLPARLNGMWAFAIYDRPRRRIFLSRDRFGEKPLYYTRQNGVFAFASELSSLVRHRSVQAPVSRLGLKKYLAYGFIPAPRSIYQGIEKLPAGHNLVLDVGDLTFRVERYWDFVIEPFERIPRRPLEEWGAELRRLLAQAVERRLVADVPLGVFLSGGIDSSAVTALAAGLVKGRTLETFSIGFEEPGFDESNHAREVAARFGTEHHPRKVSLAEARAITPEVLSRLDEPMADSSLVPTFLLAKAARERVTVALGGDGSDELLGGYDPFRALGLARLYSRIVPRPVHGAIRFLAAALGSTHGYMSFDFRLKRALRGLSHPPALWNPVWLGPLEPAEIRELLDEPVDEEEVYSEAIEHWDRCPGEDLVDRTTRFYVKLYLQDDILVKTDRASMMHSLEVRAPFLDLDLVDFLRRVPRRFKFHRGRSKLLLRKAMEPLLPRSVLSRKKQGFALPIGRWFKEGSLEPDRARTKSPSEDRFIRRTLESHRRGRQDHRLYLWSELVLGHHLRASNRMTP